MKNNIKTLKKLLGPCMEEENIDFLWLTGSLARGITSDNIDIITGVKILNQKSIQIISEKISLLKEVVEKPEMFDDALRFKISNHITISLGLYKTTNIFQRLKNYTNGKFINGEKRPWAINSWIPESFCADVKDSIALYDNNELLLKAKKMLNPYPDALANSIITLSKQEIEQKFKKLDSGILAEKILVFADLVSCITRMMFANEHIYFLGYKNVLKQLRCLKSKQSTKIIELWKKHKLNEKEIVKFKELVKEVSK